MATIKISEMTDAILLQDNDYIPILQNGLNKKVKVELLRDYNNLYNKPIINGVTVEHNKTITDYNVVKENQGIQINEDKKTLELETLGSAEIENRADVNKAITIKTADKTAKETAHQTMSKEYQPNDQTHLSEGENQPVSYKAVKEYVDTLEAKVDENERDIEAKHTALENKVDTNESDIESKHTTLNNKVDENERDIEDKVQKLDEKTAAKDSELESLISTNEEDIESKVQELDNKKLNKEETPKKLPNPYKLKFTGAVSDEYDGSAPLSIEVPPGTGLSTEAIDKLEEVGNHLVYTTADGGSKWTELISILRNGSSGGGSGETVTLQSISATYTGGEVAVGTSLDSLTGITVTAHYSDGSTATITGYTLSGEIVEGENTIMVSYEGKTTTFTVVGYVEEAETTEPVYRLAEATTFDGTNTVDTGYALCENYKAFTVVVDFTSTTKSGSVFGCDKNVSYGVGVKCQSGYYWSAYWGDRVNKDVHNASNGVKYVITHEVNSNIAKAYYIYEDALTTQEFTLDEGNYNSHMNFTNTVILGNDFTGIINDFKIYESVLSQEEINAYVGV